MRRAAIILNVHRKTIERKMRYLSIQARISQGDFLQHFFRDNGPIQAVVFDEMETFEHSKMKPLSIPLLVTPKRKIIAAQVAQMPAKGHLAARARKKYGFRKDERPKVIRKMFDSLRPFIDEHAQFLADQNPHYPKLVLSEFPRATLETTKGARGCVTGQGELKRLQWDPLFALNHTAAMFRANMNRLFRRTWCTSKIPAGLKNHIDIYIDYHNQVLTK